MSLIIDKWYHAGHQYWCSMKMTTDKFVFQINRKAKSDLSFQQACDQAALDIAQTWSHKPLFIALSGGLDSELTAKTFLRNKIDFTPFILEIGQINQIETWYAHRWCFENNIKPVIYSMSLQELVTDVIPLLQFLPYTNQTGTIINLWLAQYIAKQGGHCILAVGDINWDDDQKVFYNNIVDWAVDMTWPDQHPCGFLSYSPELVLSYIKQFDETLNEQYNKLNFYQLSPRPKINYLEKMFSSHPVIKQAIHRHSIQNPPAAQHTFGSKQQLISLLS